MEVAKETKTNRVLWQRIPVTNGYSAQFSKLEFNIEFPQDGPVNLSVYDLTRPGPIPGLLADGQPIIGDKLCLGGFTTHQIPELRELFDVVSDQVQERKKQSEKKETKKEQEKRLTSVAMDQLEHEYAISERFFSRISRAG